MKLQTRSMLAALGQLSSIIYHNLATSNLLVLMIQYCFYCRTLATIAKMKYLYVEAQIEPSDMCILPQNMLIFSMYL
jgi:hypothetical protein